MLPVLKYHQLSNKQFKEKYRGHIWEGFSTFVFLKCLFLYQAPCIFQKRPEDSTNKYQCKANKATWELFWPSAPVKVVPVVTPQSTGLLQMALPLSLAVLCCPTHTSGTSQVTSVTVCPSRQSWCPSRRQSISIVTLLRARTHQLKIRILYTNKAYENLGV